jgi:protoheme IX farnesyltransferase
MTRQARELVRAQPTGLTSALVDYAALTKPRIGAFVFLAALTGALVAGGREAPLALALEAALWTSVAAGAANAFNQVLERDSDRLMERTRNRPLPAGRLKLGDAVLFAAALGAASTAGLALRFGLLAGLLALATIAAYALVYTPLKRASTLNTVFGALPGAMPPLIGYAALAGRPDAWAWWLFALVFAWQFPHFMAIAWLNRADYARAGMLMIPALPGGERLAGLHALGYALALVPVALLPLAAGAAGVAYGFGALALALGYAAAAALFARRQSARRARLLLAASLVHLPLHFSCVLLDPLVQRSIVNVP